MDYVAYYRVSTTMQGKSGLGLQAQRQAVSDYVKSGTVIAEYTEIESGKNSDRPQLQLALDWAKAHNATLLIAKLDRLSRNLHFITGLMEQNVPMIACDMPHANKFQWHIMGAVAEQERDFISERTKAAIAKRREQGVKWGTNKARSEQAKEFAETLRAFVQSLLQRDIDTPAAIMRELNQHGYTTIRGGKWGTGQVARLLQRLAG